MRHGFPGWKAPREVLDVPRESPVGAKRSRPQLNVATRQYPHDVRLLRILGSAQPGWSRVALAVVLATSGTACVRRPPSPPTPACAMSQADTGGWESVDFGVFSFRIPPGYRRVVRVTEGESARWRAGPGRVIFVEFGRWAPGVQSYSLLLGRSSCLVAIDERIATLVSGWSERENYVFAAVWQLRSDISLNITVTTPDRQEQQRLLSVLRSVRFRS